LGDELVEQLKNNSNGEAPEQCSVTLESFLRVHCSSLQSAIERLTNSTHSKCIAAQRSDTVAFCLLLNGLPPNKASEASNRSRYASFLNLIFLNAFLTFLHLRMARAVVNEDYYAILGVSQSATLAVIREAYKKCALKYHPDKNLDNGEDTTPAFQQLGVAWETLKDATKRAQYDREVYVRLPKRKREKDAEVETEAARARRRREEVDRDASARWSAENSQSPGGGQDFQEESARIQRARRWKASAREDYLARLQRWIDFRKGRLPDILECQRLIEKHQSDLDIQIKEDEEEVARKFQDAIERSKSSGLKIENHAAILSKLLEARRLYTARLAESIADSRKQLAELLLVLENDRRRYESEENRVRQQRVQEALGILGPRDLNPPLFSIIDRRGQAINTWKALSRVKCAVNFGTSLELSEGPWHQSGDSWERVVGEHICGRCDQRAFHIIPECGPAKCPCGLIACTSCFRDLQLLREYGEWITSSDSEKKESIFSLEFDSNERPEGFWKGRSDYFGFGCTYD
jgi:curved DNA-binding protein CbpA